MLFSLKILAWSLAFCLDMNSALFCPGQPCGRADTIKRLCGPIRSGGGLAVGAGLATGARRFMDTSQGRLTWTRCGQAASSTHAQLHDRQRHDRPGPACAARRARWPEPGASSSPWGPTDGCLGRRQGQESSHAGQAEFMPVFANRDRHAPLPHRSGTDTHTPTLTFSFPYSHSCTCPSAHARTRTHTQNSKCHPLAPTAPALRSAFFLLKS